MKQGVFYGVGVGPGDPDLITVKAIKIIEKADCIIIPKSARDSESTAGEIIKKYIKPKTEIKFVVFPMGSDKNVMEIYEKTGDEISSGLSTGKNIVFVTIGDPLFYSTFCYLKYFVEKEKYLTESVPGVFSFAAIASKLGITLGIQNDKLAVITDYSVQETEQILDIFDTVVFLKIKRYFGKVKNILGEKDLLKNCFMVSNCGMPDEETIENLSELEPEKIPYLSTMILRKGNKNGKR